MKTELLYLEDTYLFKETAKVVGFKENEKGKAVILDRTIFYPQGGGQPSDLGTIENENGTFEVTFVGLDPEGIVWHFGEFTKGSFQEGEEVQLEIDEERRKLNARVHSAGHLIDCAVQSLGIDIKPYKGFHFSEGPYIESEGEIEDTEEVKEKVQTKVTEMVENCLAMSKQNLTAAEAAERNIIAPVGKGVRIVGFEGHESCGCGGTHVENSEETRGITIRKVSSKKGKTKISYSVA